MTREEAIEFGKMWLELQEECKNSNTYEFFKMAIEALQQEPTYTGEVAQKAYEDGKKDGYMQRKIETIAENDLKADYVERKEVKRIAKEMYLEVANMELDVSTISDCISYTSSKCREVLERKLQALSSVTPQEPRKGHWIYDYTSADGHRTYHCSECGCYLQPKYSEPLNSFKWCSLCGADMREMKE